MLAATAIDQFALFGAAQRPLSLMRGAGLAMMAAGIALIQRG